jgi:3-hydroxymyristoyl/3-hydroxydecanoyl-(acyl carrier protein) dehydratase
MKFRLVDKIIDFEKEVSIETAKAVSFEEFSLLKRWGRKGAFPETLLLQFAVESASLLIAGSTGFASMGVLAEAGPVRFFSPSTPGDIVHASLQAASVGMNRWEIKFTLKTQREPIADGLLSMDLVALDTCFETKYYLLMWKERDVRTR